MKTTFCGFLTAGLLASTSTLAAPGGAVSGGGARVAPTPTPPPVRNIGPGTTVPQPGINPPNNNAPSTFTKTAATNSSVLTTNSFAGTNGLVGAGSNFSSTAGTANPLTNGAVLGTNTQINGNLVVGDQALTPSDRVLLTTLSQRVRASLGTTPDANVPVHFMINNGTVTVLGTAQSAEQRQGILSQVQQTPGVLTVVNDLQVASPMATAQTQNAQNGFFSGVKDHAFSPRDQTLLTTVQQQAAMQLGINNSAQMPIHFSIQNGVVGVMGRVSSLQEKQALIGAILKTPGIVRVVDNVAVIGGAAAMNSGTVNGAVLPPTSRPATGSNTIFLNTTNASGF